MAFDFDETSPAGSSYIADFPANERAFRGEVKDSLSVDHDAEDTGKHNKVTLIPLAVKPVASGTPGFLYTKEISTITELFYEDEGGQEIQLTNNGSASPDKVAVAGGEMTGALQFDNAVGVEGRDVGDANYRNLIQVDASDVCEVGDQSLDGGLRLNADAVDSAVVAYGSGDKKIYHAGHFTRPLFITTYESDPIAFVSGSSATNGTDVHEIGAAPLFWRAVMRCTTTDLDYPVGAEISVDNGLQHDSDPHNFTICLLDAATFSWQAPSTTIEIMENNASKTSSPITDTSWRLVIYAWY